MSEHQPSYEYDEYADVRRRFSNAVRVHFDDSNFRDLDDETDKHTLAARLHTNVWVAVSLQKTDALRAEIPGLDAKQVYEISFYNENLPKPLGGSTFGKNKNLIAQILLTEDDHQLVHPEQDDLRLSLGILEALAAIFESGHED